ncbi:YceI family protein [Deinococcus aquatilis]|jgi:polyisoprenoid-binding protein YceI|uniref:YceI family protein n=1 Tax=Deinococcus aquatilis TaxID=519440 RepID=UPI00036D118D|nr:YceI family protein [Deinococcus aquatilis]
MKPPLGTAYGAVLTLTLAFGSIAAAQTAQPYAAVTAAMPQVQFNFRVTLIPVPGRVQQVTASLKLDPLRPQDVTGTVQVPLKTLMTGIGLRDEHARNYLKAGQFPVATFRVGKLSGVTALPVGQEVSGQVSGSFSLAGVTRPLTAPVTLRREASGRINIATQFDIPLKDYGISIRGADKNTDVRLMFAVTAR